MPKDVTYIGSLAEKMNPQPLAPVPVTPASVPDVPLKLVYKYEGTINGRPVETILLDDVEGLPKTKMLAIAWDPANRKQLQVQKVSKL